MDFPCDWSLDIFTSSDTWFQKIKRSRQQKQGMGFCSTPQKDDNSWLDSQPLEIG